MLTNLYIALYITFFIRFHIFHNKSNSANWQYLRWINFSSSSFSRYRTFWSRYIFVMPWTSSCYFRNFRMYLVTISISTCAKVPFSPVYNRKFYRTRSISPSLLLYGRSIGLSDATFVLSLRSLSVFFFIVFLLLWDYDNEDLCTIVEISVNGKSSD